MRPGPPRPLSRMRWPSSTPAGMRTLTSRGRRSTPAPGSWGTDRSIDASRAPARRARLAEARRSPGCRRARPGRRSCGQVDGWVPGAAPRAAAGRAGGVAHEVDRGGDAVDGVAEGQVELGLEVGAPLRPGAGPATGHRRRPPRPNRPPSRSPMSPRSSARKLKPPAPARRPAPPDRSRPGPSLRTSSYSLRFSGSPTHVVGGGDLLEALLGLGVTGVGVGVVLAGQLAVGAGDLLLGRVSATPRTL